MHFKAGSEWQSYSNNG